MIPYKLTKEQLLFDLFIAFYNAAKHKHSKPYVKFFKKDLYNNLVKLRDDLYNRTYEEESSTCFIVNLPKKREIFAANFRDRIVQHLYFNYTHEMFEREFILDTYSCIKDRGTGFGIERLVHHIRSESKDWSIPCYALKIDISGYFIHIRKDILLKIVLEDIDKFEYKIAYSDKQWCEILDFEFIRYLTEKIVMVDPTKKCKIKSKKFEYNGLPVRKSLFFINRLCGIPLGNITSQLFSNIYLNRHDQFVKRVLKCKHYGRYVDDSYYISKDKQFLLSLVPKMTKFLKEELDLDVNQGKTQLIEVKYGVEFLGAFIKPFRIYASNQSIRRMKLQMNLVAQNSYDKIHSNISRMGMLKHYREYNTTLNMFYDIKKPTH